MVRYLAVAPSRRSRGSSVASARRAIARRRGHRALAALGLAGSGIRNGSEVAAAAWAGRVTPDVPGRI